MSTITVTIRLSNADKVNVEIETTSSILALKQKIEAKLNVAAAQQRLIYKGRVLKDDVALEFYGIQNEHTVHMVKGSGASGPNGNTTSSSPSTASSAPMPAASPSMGGGGALGDNSALNTMMNNPAMAGNPQAMQQQLMQNPELMASVMNSPMMESMMNNPEMMRSMMMSNPQMQQMMESNPQLREVFNDPAMLRQSMEMMRNPHAMQQAMRSQDLQISQLENHPLGFNALRRMQEDVADPLMRAAQEGSATTPNPWAASAAAQQQSSTPNTDALPNPWGGAVTNAQGGAGGANPFAGMGGAGGANPFAGMGGAGGMGGMDPNQMASLMSNPMMQQQMQRMMNDPATMQQMAAMNPAMAPMLNDPQFRAMMSNPQVMQQMMNPATMQAAMRMQQGGGMGMFGAPAANPGLGGMDFGSLLSPPAPAAGATTTAPPAAPQQPPAQRYAAELAQLQSMGFLDDERSLRVLATCSGNVNVAVERLLGGN